MTKRKSAPVTRADRAGRAPYNFVPLPLERWKEVGGPPPANSYLSENGEALLSGEIVLSLEALTDFYIRGMWPLEGSAPLKDVKDQTQPFLVDGRLRLPGSSLRGMVRTLVEILGRAPLQPVNDQQLFFRAVAATNNPRDRGSFEPQAVAYKNQIGETDEVKVGYLYGGTAGWYIQPAIDKPKKWYRIRTMDKWKRERVTFTPGEPWSYLSQNGIAGWLVCSGPMQKKKAQWLIPGEDKTKPRVDIPEDDVTAYKEAGISQEILRNRFEYSDQSKGVPCFYVEWPDRQRIRHVSFGHTPNLRLPYRTTTANAIPPVNRRDVDNPAWDLGQALFGRTEGKVSAVKGQKGRLRFEDALLEGTRENSYEPIPVSVVLGAPKPTTYQHYLVQAGDEVTQAIHWDGDYRGSGKAGVDVIVRGHKLYWHRPDAPVRLADSRQERVSTSIQPAHKGARFGAVIHYENLRSYELGALLMALELPQGCAHHLGMGKPLGLGSFRLHVRELRQVDRLRRYEKLFEGDSLATGISASVPLFAPGSPDEFLSEFLSEFYPGCPDLEALWRDDRLAELKALLTFDGLPRNWSDRTRYLEFGKLKEGPLAGSLYNEYLNAGYPNKRLEKRRPLPPATQVLRAGPETPADPRPPFEGPAPVRSLRSGRSKL